MQRNEYRARYLCIQRDNYGAFGDVHILTTTTCKLSGEECAVAAKYYLLESFIEWILYFVEAKVSLLRLLSYSAC